jgi:hypothetical protein
VTGTEVETLANTEFSTKDFLEHQDRGGLAQDLLHRLVAIL